MSNTSSQVCYICKCNPKDMNNIEKCRKKRMYKHFLIILDFQHFMPGFDFSNVCYTLPID